MLGRKSRTFFKIHSLKHSQLDTQTFQLYPSTCPYFIRWNHLSSPTTPPLTLWHFTALASYQWSLPPTANFFSFLGICCPPWPMTWPFGIGASQTSLLFENLWFVPIKPHTLCSYPHSRSFPIRLFSSPSFFLHFPVIMSRMSGFLAFLVALLLVGVASSAKFDELFQPSWALDHFTHEADLLKLKLDNYSGNISPFPFDSWTK